MNNPRCQKQEQTFGDLLKFWRQDRRFSQLELALETRVSQRHLSFLESGRAHPSRAMVLHLARALNIPMRERNNLLLVAGYAPMYPARSLSDAQMAGIRLALEITLRHHEPFPALVVDRQWNVILNNQAVDRLISLIGQPASVWNTVDPTGRRNLMRLMLHPEGLQPLWADWPATAKALLSRLEAEARANPRHVELRGLIEELRSLTGISTTSAAEGEVGFMEVPTMTVKMQNDQVTLQFFSMISTFGAALDVTADELRLELLFPSDNETAEFLTSVSSTTRSEGC